MFDWKKDESTLIEGPFELRMVEKPFPRKKDIALLSPWRDMINEVLHGPLYVAPPPSNRKPSPNPDSRVNWYQVGAGIAVVLAIVISYYRTY